MHTFGRHRQMPVVGRMHLPLANLTRVLPQEPGRISTISVYVGILGECLRFKPHWMFLIYLRVTKN